MTSRSQLQACVRALTVAPGEAGSARLDDIAEPPISDGPVLVDTLAIGVCGTDVDLVRGLYGTPPPGRRRLLLGHESLGRVREAPRGCGLAPGDLVVGVVRRPDPRLITRRVPLREWAEALERRPDDVKPIVDPRC